jgi:hypothetical protein
MSAPITVSLVDLPTTLARGEWLVPGVRVNNHGEDAVSVSGRLNLFEGDLRLQRRGPDGGTATLRGAVDLDSFPRLVDLPADSALESGVFLAYTSAGLSFETPGRYELRAAYDPGDGRATVVSEPVDLQVTAAGPDPDAELAAVADETVARAVALTGLDADPAATASLRTLADRFPDRREGILAALALAGAAVFDDEDPSPDGSDPREDVEATFTRALESHSPRTLAHWVTALSGPGGESPLVDACLAAFDATDGQATTARRILRGEPFAPE